MADLVGAVDAARVDVDGTLVDSSYHHTLAWYRAFREAGRTIEAWRLHRHIGMGGERLVPAVGGGSTPCTGMRCGPAGGGMRTLRLVTWSRAAGRGTCWRDSHAAGCGWFWVVLASSGPAEHVERYVDLLGARGVARGVDDVDATKPAPDLLRSMDRVGATRSFVIGDSPWDAVATRRLGLPAVAV